MHRTRLGFNALAIGPQGSGVQTYVRELLNALDSRIDAELTAHVQDIATHQLPSAVHAYTHRRSSGVRRAISGLRPVTGYDLFHGLDVDIPVRASAPTVATVHDLSVFDVPWAFPKHRIHGERLLIMHALRRADAVIAVSEFTAQRVAERFGREATVTHLAPRSELRRSDNSHTDDVHRRYCLPDRFVLHVGNIEARKGIGPLAQACQRHGVPLVLAGAGHSEASWPGDVRELGYVPAADLAPLYRVATVVAYPSLYEGFGLPPIEAIACGATVLATSVGALPELLGSVMPLPTPGDDVAYRNALGDVLTDATARQEMARSGARIVDGLSWDKTAQKTIDVYRTLGCSV